MTTSINSLNHHSDPVLSEKEDIDALEEAFQFVRSRILASANFPNRDNALIKFLLFKNNLSLKYSTVGIKNLPINIRDQYFRIASMLQSNLGMVRKEKKQFYLKQAKSDPFLNVLFAAQIAKDFPVGNCGELARIAFYFLLIQHHFRRIEICFLSGGDHFFDILDSQYVLDCWSDKNNIFAAKDIDVFLEDFKGLDENRNPITKKINPQNQSVKNYMSNIYSSDDIRSKLHSNKDDKDALDWFLSKLDAFYAQSDDEQKAAIAKEIIATRPKVLHEDNVKVARSVISQMKCFLDKSYGDIYNLGPISTITSVFEDWKVEANCLKDHISAITIDYMIKIMDLFNKNQRNKGFKNVFRMPAEIRNLLLAADKKIGKEKYHSRNARIAKAAYRWTMDQIKKGLENKRYEEAFKIFKKLPSDIRNSINTNLFELVEASGISDISYSEDLFYDLETNQIFDDFRLSALDKDLALPKIQRLFPILDLKDKNHYFFLQHPHVQPSLSQGQVRSLQH